MERSGLGARWPTRLKGLYFTTSEAMFMAVKVECSFRAAYKNIRREPFVVSFYGTSGVPRVV